MGPNTMKTSFDARFRTMPVFAPKGQPFTQPRATPWVTGEPRTFFGPTGQRFSFFRGICARITIHFSILSLIPSSLLLAQKPELLLELKPNASKEVD
jgi:hypothetical protein